jgi:hypothetical protein
MTVERGPAAISNRRAGREAIEVPDRFVGSSTLALCARATFPLPAAE